MTQTRFTTMVDTLKKLAVGDPKAPFYVGLEPRAARILDFDRAEVVRNADSASDKLFGALREAAIELRASQPHGAWRSLLTRSLAQWCELARTSSEGTLPVDQPVVLTETRVITGTRDAIARAGYSLEEINTPRTLTPSFGATGTLQRTVRPAGATLQGQQTAALNPDWFKILSVEPLYPLSLLPPRR